MDKIVQLKEYEYNELQEQANYNQSEIEKCALEMYQERGTFEIRIYVDFDDRDYHEMIKFRVCSFVDDKGDLDKFQLSYKDRERIVDYVNRKMYEFVERKFGRQIKYANNWTDRLRRLRNWKIKFIGLMIFGWLAAIALCLIAILK